MAKLTISDFEVGDHVYHLSNPKISMVVIKINENPDEVTCRWINSKGDKIVEEFIPQELDKTKNSGLGIYSI